MPDRRGWTLLHLAMAPGSKTIMRHLLENGAVWRAETQPSLDEVPDAIAGISASVVEVAAAYGDKRYLEFLDILDDVRDRDQEMVAEKGEEWGDAVETQS